MENLIQVVLLGIIEGITEFLPISSTGHLLIAEQLGLGHRSEVFNIGIQAGAILAVVFIYWSKLWALIRDPFEPSNRHYLLLLLAAFSVTAAGALIAKGYGLELPNTLAPIAWALLIGGIAILLIERLAEGQAVEIHAIGENEVLRVRFPPLHDNKTQRLFEADDAVLRLLKDDRAELEVLES